MKNQTATYLSSTWGRKLTRSWRVLSRDRHQISVSNHATAEGHHIPSSGPLRNKDLVWETSNRLKVITFRMEPRSSRTSCRFLQKRWTPLCFVLSMKTRTTTRVSIRRVSCTNQASCSGLDISTRRLLRIVANRKFGSSMKEASMSSSNMNWLLHSR